jgi:hypothetical protein
MGAESDGLNLGDTRKVEIIVNCGLAIVKTEPISLTVNSFLFSVLRVK